MTIAGKPQRVEAHAFLQKDGTYKTYLWVEGELVQCSDGWHTLCAAFATAASRASEAHVSQRSTSQQVQDTLL